MYVTFQTDGRSSYLQHMVDARGGEWIISVPILGTLALADITDL